MNRRKIIYMDNAATTKMSRDTLAAMEPYFAKNMRIHRVPMSLA